MIHKTPTVHFSIMWCSILLHRSVIHEVLLAIICWPAYVGMKFQLDILSGSWNLVGLRSVWLFKVSLFCTSGCYREQIRFKRLALLFSVPSHLEWFRSSKVNGLTSWNIIYSDLSIFVIYILKFYRSVLTEQWSSTCKLMLCAKPIFLFHLKYTRLDCYFNSSW